MKENGGFALNYLMSKESVVETGKYISPDDYAETSLILRNTLINSHNLLSKRSDVTKEYLDKLADRINEFRDKLAATTNNILEVYGGEEILTEEENIEMYNKNKEYLDKCSVEYNERFREFKVICEEIYVIFNKEV